MAVIRRLEKEDYSKGYLDLLEDLTVVNKENISQEMFNDQFDRLNSHNSEVYVIDDNGDLIGSGTLVVEPKFIHTCGSVGHIEDIVISKNFQCKGYGKILIDFLTTRAEECNCYKVILDCSEKYQGFYDKCGFELKGIQMAKYF